MIMGGLFHKDVFIYKDQNSYDDEIEDFNQTSLPTNCYHTDGLKN